MRSLHVTTEKAFRLMTNISDWHVTLGNVAVVAGASHIRSTHWVNVTQRICARLLGALFCNSSLNGTCLLTPAATIAVIFCDDPVEHFFLHIPLFSNRGNTTALAHVQHCVLATAVVWYL